MYRSTHRAIDVPLLSVPTSDIGFAIFRNYRGTIILLLCANLKDAHKAYLLYYPYLK